MEKILKIIYGPNQVEKTFKIINKMKLGSLYSDPDMVSLVKKGRIRCLGYVPRMDQGRLPWKIIEGQLDGKRGRHSAGRDGWKTYSFWE